ncbi:hypothetical protein PFDSM3638_07010 [Pyrococcus furiosus DSM 3638]|uniref:Uncharacterized protein n=3 Tax=Pyrococcus furiosus TaxID=2261 RepID=Q8U129_PYRFU|nr:MULTISPECIES: hypothetical protein [Pyrococcus]AAL81524.1 hypothetical protein PF1400 [Pyrococcus furiosus DSM 3638]AFN04181.1 hypothetical protein PFC_06225 [Pyrococcus furiosus COM1]MDK2868876.1 hypothetical protein [Pyrococcus sp.]QEK79032.1 hypothetical protein PFDSM3638_07010 [Pyrococcus furiosus DSM 3638]
MRKYIAGIFLITIILASIGITAYGYAKFNSILISSPDFVQEKYIVIKFPNSTYVVLSQNEYIEARLKGWKPPEGSIGYIITLSYNPKSPPDFVLEKRYEEFTIVVGSPEVKTCSKNPDEFKGSCTERTLAVSEVTLLVSTLFKRYFYAEAIARGLSNESAKMYAYEETMKRRNIRYLSLLVKAQVGLGLIGNEKHLGVIIMGPAEGANETSIIIPREGLIILKGKSDSSLRAEAILLENLVGLQFS